jgi:hypothetical protein
VLDLLDGFSQMVLKSDSDENIYFDTSTGELPYLVTNQGTFQYTIPSTYYRLKEIVVREEVRISNNPVYSRHDLNHVSNEISIQGRRYRVIHAVKNQPYGTGTCTVMFRDDPGNTTTTYQIYGYVPVNAITSISSNLNIPEEFHMSVVIPAIQLLIDGIENGRYVDNLKYINETLLPKIIFNKLQNSMQNYSTRPMDI